jgi:hypothetical protein
MLTGQKYLPKGPFQLGGGATSLFIGWGAVVLIMFFNIFYCFRKYILFLPLMLWFLYHQADWDGLKHIRFLLRAWL